MSDMADSANIEGGLPAHDLRSIRGQFGDIFIVLWFEFVALDVKLLDFILGEARVVLHGNIWLLAFWISFILSTTGSDCFWI